MLKRSFFLSGFIFSTPSAYNVELLLWYFIKWHMSSSFRNVNFIPIFHWIMTVAYRQCLGKRPRYWICFIFNHMQLTLFWLASFFLFVICCSSGAVVKNLSVIMLMTLNGFDLLRASEMMSYHSWG